MTSCRSARLRTGSCWTSSAGSSVWRSWWASSHRTHPWTWKRRSASSMYWGCDRGPALGGAAGRQRAVFEDGQNQGFLMEKPTLDVYPTWEVRRPLLWGLFFWCLRFWNLFCMWFLILSFSRLYCVSVFWVKICWKRRLIPWQRGRCNFSVRPDWMGLYQQEEAAPSLVQWPVGRDGRHLTAWLWKYFTLGSWAWRKYVVSLMVLTILKVFLKCSIQQLARMLGNNRREGVVWQGVGVETEGCEWSEDLGWREDRADPASGSEGAALGLEQTLGRESWGPVTQRESGQIAAHSGPDLVWWSSLRTESANYGCKLRMGLHF